MKLKKLATVGMIGASIIFNVNGCKRPPNKSFENKVVVDSVEQKDSLYREEEKRIKKWHEREMSKYAKKRLTSYDKLKKESIDMFENYVNYSYYNMFSLSLAWVETDSFDIDIKDPKPYDIIMLSSSSYSDAFKLACNMYFESNSEKERYDIVKAIVRIMDEMCHIDKYNSDPDLPKHLFVEAAGSFAEGVFRSLWWMLSVRERKMFAFAYIKTIKSVCKSIEENENYSVKMKIEFLEEYRRRTWGLFSNIFEIYLTDEESSEIDFLNDVQEWMYRHGKRWPAPEGVRSYIPKEELKYYYFLPNDAYNFLMDIRKKRREQQL